MTNSDVDTSSALRNSSEPSRLESQGCLPALEWFGVGFVFPCFSPTFYYRAARRRLVGALIFFFVFGALIAGLQTLGLALSFAQAGWEIRRAFESGDFPEIRISDGVAEVSGPQPYVLISEDGMFVAIDTTGAYTRIDRTQYTQGFLLTRTKLIMLTQQGEYQEIPLRELQRALGVDPFILNDDTAMVYWGVLSLLVLTLALTFLLFWHTLLRLAYLLLIGLAFWGATVLLFPGMSFAPVLATGLYALVPVLYLRLCLSQVGVSFPFLFTLLLIPSWTLALAAAFMPPTIAAPTSFLESFRAHRPLRGWRVLIALPLLLDLALEVIFHWDAWYVTWPLAGFTFIALLVISLLGQARLADAAQAGVDVAADAE